MMNNHDMQGITAPAVPLTDWRTGLSPHLVEGIIRVCSWHQPGDSIYQERPEWRGLGLTISHGVCKNCKEKITKKIYDNTTKISD